MGGKKNPLLNNGNLTGGFAMTTNDELFTGETIDLTPKWQGLLPIMLQVLEDPNFPPEAKANIRSELTRLAKFVDEMNEDAKATE